MKVSYVKGQDLYKSTLKALGLIKDEIKVNGKKILIKPNFVSTYVPLCATHVDEIKAIVDFLRKNFEVGEIIVAESSAIGEAEDGFRNYNYYENLKDVEFVNLDNEEHVEVEIFKRFGIKGKVRVSKLLTDKKNFIVSAAKLKSHDTVVATLSAKNVIMGSMLEKEKMHQGYKLINKNLAEVMKKLHIELAVLDGINGMEGNGPVSGTRINANCVIASGDFLAADRVGLEVMGIKPEKVGYLNYISELGFGEFDLGKIKIVGDEIEKRKFKLHSDVEEQYEWR